MEETKEKKVEDIRKEAGKIKCPAQRALYYTVEFLNGPMCGKCFPCEIGSFETKLKLEKIVSGKGTEGDLQSIRKIASEMLEISRCKRGKDTAQFIIEWTDTDAFRAHIEGSRCPEKECKALIEYRIIPEKCTMCGLCLDACPSGAIIGQKRVSWKSGYLPFEIRQKRCTRSGQCKKVCPADAVEIIDVGAPLEAALK